MDGIIAYALSRKYTKESLLGGGAVVGKNVKVSSITEVDGGNEVTFSYTLDDGTVNTSSMIVEDGASVSSMIIDENNHLVCTMSDGSTIDAGEMPALSSDVETYIDEKIEESVSGAISYASNDDIDLMW